MPCSSRPPNSWAPRAEPKTDYTRASVSESWQVFKIDELDSIVFTCPECGTQSVFVMSGDPAGKTERHCPGCNKTIPRAGEILYLYRALCATVKSAAENEKLSVTFRARA